MSLSIYFSAAWQKVPQVSAMSSTKIAILSLTSPTSTIVATSLAFFLSLWISAKSTFSLSAMEVTLWQKKSHLLFKIVWDVWFTICLQTGIPNFSIKYQNVIRNTCTCPTLPNELLYSWSNYSSISLGLICFTLDLFAPPASGETIQLFLHSGIVSLIHFRTAGSAYRLSTGMSKNPWQYLTTAILAIIKCRF